MELNKLAKQMWEVTNKRQKNGADISTDTVHMLKHTATEVVEAIEAHVRYLEDFDTITQQLFAKELADIVACVLIIAAEENIDIEYALEAVYEKNKARAELRGDKK